eukprot:GHVS01047969.1.p1 GENE.GHVS01047969.1~~GHVS01047969.1.p1  ORF type:complete len:160 (+),score=31.24 GHVS01047969.1:68-547(+)
MQLTRACRLAVSAGGVTNKLLLTLCSSSETMFVRTPVDSVTVPGSEGAFTVTNNHSQNVSQLRNGVVTVRQEGKEPKQFFLSDGFLFYKSPRDDSGCCTAEVVGVEMVSCDLLDKEKAVQTMQEVLQSAASGGGTAWDKTKGQLGQELCAAVIRSSSSS